jgi:hypothetical protein
LEEINMNNWVIAGIIIGLLLVGGIALVSAVPP